MQPPAPCPVIAGEAVNSDPGEPGSPLLQAVRSELTDFRRRIRSDLERGLIQLLKLEKRWSNSVAARMLEEMQRIVNEAVASRSASHHTLCESVSVDGAAAAATPENRSSDGHVNAHDTSCPPSQSGHRPSTSVETLTPEQFENALRGLESRLLADRLATVNRESAADAGTPPLTFTDLDRALESTECRILARIDAVTAAIHQLPASVLTPRAAAPEDTPSSPATPAAQASPEASQALPSEPRISRKFTLPVKHGTGVRSWEEIKQEILRAEGLCTSDEPGRSTSDRLSRDNGPASTPQDSAESGDTSESLSSESRSTPAQSPAAEPQPELPALNPLTSDRHFRLPEQDPLLELPPVPDVDRLNLAELRNAFHQREDFISALIARLRRQQEATMVTMSAEQLRQLVEHLPDELALQVRYTLKQMNELARMTELELSLERARIARQVSQLEHSRQILEHNARQLGMKLNEDGSIAISRGARNRDRSSRRWLGKLGFGQ